MTDVNNTIKNILELVSNTYGFENQTCNISYLKYLILTTIKNCDMFLIEDCLANINKYSIQIHKDKRSTFCINCLKTVTYNSIDPTFRIINNGTYIIKYTYDNKDYRSFPMSTYDIDIISNYAFFHDVIFSHILKQY